MASRKKINPAVEARVLSSSARRCCLCFHLDQDLGEKNGQIAHVDQNRTNGVEDNLAFLCLDHHAEYDSKTSQRKNYTAREVKLARAKLYSAVAKRITCEWSLVLDAKFSEFDRPRVEAIVEHLRKIVGDPLLTVRRILLRFGSAYSEQFA